MDEFKSLGDHKELKFEFSKVFKSTNLGQISNANELGFDENNENCLNFLNYDEEKIVSNTIKRDESENEDLSKMWGNNSYKFNEREYLNSPQKRSKNIESITPLNSDKKAKGGRSAKGLRVLSMKVRDIVYEKKATTYKQVAEELIKVGNTPNNWVDSFPLDNLKDEQNVKRRVYDALNVLIAADILVKKGKLVTVDEEVHAKYTALGVKQEKAELENYEQTLKRKKLELREIIKKYSGIKSLIARNKRVFSCENDDDDSVACKRIKFPFIAIGYSKLHKLSVSSLGQGQEVNITSNTPLNIYGDIDIILKIGYPSQSEENEDISNLPLEMQAALQR